MIPVTNYKPLAGDIVTMKYDTHNEDTNIGTDWRNVKVLSDECLNIGYHGETFNGYCEEQQKTFYSKRIIFAFIQRHDSWLIYASDKYDQETDEYLGNPNDR